MDILPPVGMRRFAEGESIPHAADQSSPLGGHLIPLSGCGCGSPPLSTRHDFDCRFCAAQRNGCCGLRRFLELFYRKSKGHDRDNAGSPNEADCEPANIWPRTDMQKHTGNLNREHRRLVRSARRARDLTDHCAFLRVLGVACGFGLGAPIPTARRPLLRAAQSCPYSRRLDRHD